MIPVLVVAYAAAGLSGFLLTVAVRQRAGAHARHRRMKASMRVGAGLDSHAANGMLPESGIIGLLRRSAGVVQPNWLRAIARMRVWDICCANLPAMLARAGIADTVSPETVKALRVRMVFAGVLAGALVGAVFSAEFAAVLAVAGCGLGFYAIPASLRGQAKARNADMERHLSEMVEVVVLGLQSGLSFERSFMLYPRYFQTELGRSMTRVSSQWEMGLITREEALHALESEYDSPLLSRVVRSMVRSLRFGTSITDALEAAAIEAREVHRARMEERVAKVAVKMMLPVGALILPAMLLLVLGPVMLELVQGF